MADATTLRLDTVDVAFECGWQVESTGDKDEFSKDGITIAAEYSRGDAINSIARGGKNREREVFGSDSLKKVERLRTWLAGREVAAQVNPSMSPISKLRWSRENWLYKPTQEIVDNDNPRVPQTVDAAKKQSKIWYLVGSEAHVDNGYYRREMDMKTAAAAEPTYTATWNPLGGPAELVTRGTSGQVYVACVRHHQAAYQR